LEIRAATVDAESQLPARSCASRRN
jgi:hypothetical protein